jgi:predicted metal-dependent hydrolase
MMQGVLDLFGSMRPQSSSSTTPASSISSGSSAKPANGKRHIRLADRIVPYTLSRVRRRTIGMLIGTQGLEVRAPRWVSVAEIESALQEKAQWIVRKLQEMQQHQDRLHQSRIDWRDGCEVPYLGQPLRVHVQSATAARSDVALQSDAASPPATSSASPAKSRPRVSAVLLTDAAPATLQLTFSGGVAEPAAAQAEPMQAERIQVNRLQAAQIRDAVQAWMMKQARAHFQARLDHFAPMLGVQWHKLSLTSAATRWGSAGRGRDGLAAIRLNWRLMHHRLDVIDYVVVHELSHLRVMDHSPRFWDTVASVMPDYERHRRALRDEPLPPWV